MKYSGPSVFLITRTFLVCIIYNIGLPVLTVDALNLLVSVGSFFMCEYKKRRTGGGGELCPFADLGGGGSPITKGLKPLNAVFPKWEVHFKRKSLWANMDLYQLLTVLLTLSVIRGANNATSTIFRNQQKQTRWASNFKMSFHLFI